MSSFVRQHGLADDITDSINVGCVGFLLLVDSNKATFINSNASFFGINKFTVRATTYSEQYAIKGVTLGYLVAFERNFETAFLCLDIRNLGIEPDVLVAFFDAFFQWANQVAIAAGN